VPVSISKDFAPRRIDAGASVRAPKTAELVAMRLRSQIVHGELAAGDVLPTEAHLMERFGVSRPTLREAVRILETESLISSRRGTRGGAQVTGPDISVAARYVGLILQLQGTTVADVYEARMISEPAAAGLLAERHTEQDLTDLRACIDDLQALGERGFDSPSAMYEWSALTSRFHQLITERSGNKTLAVQAGVLQDIISTHHEHTLAKGARIAEPGRHFQRSMRSFEKLVTLISDGDAAGAQAHWTAHMRAAAKGLIYNGSGTTPIVDLFA
jgi:DNA-binding FadR family transcriptional regulator